MTMKTLLYYADLDEVNPYQVQLQLADKQVKLRDALMFDESNREHADEAYITPEVNEEIKERIVTYLSEVMEVFLINADPNEIELNDTDEETVIFEDEDEDGADDFFEEPDEEVLKADIENKKQAAKDAEDNAAKERSEAEAAKLVAQAEEIEADQAEAEAAAANQEVEDAECEMTRLSMITELRELDVKIPRNATKAQITELYNKHVLKADPKN